jgi:hypothetical protein
LVVAALLAGLVPAAAAAGPVRIQEPQPATGVPFAPISEADAKEWLTYLSSDALQGRQVFTEGYGMAAAYVADHLRQWGVKPMGDNGTYFQSVKLQGYRVDRRSSITVVANGESRRFANGDHVSFPVDAGGKQTLTFSSVAFAGYGGLSPDGQILRTAPADRGALAGKLVMYMPGFPRGRDRNGAIEGQPATLIGDLKAGAVLSFMPGLGAAGPSTAAAGGRGASNARRGADLITVERVDVPKAPEITADETFFDFLFSGASASFADLRARVSRGEALAPFAVPNVSVTIQIDNDYTVVSTQRTDNVVGLVEGTDPALKQTYVLFGAHLDHEGYRATAPAPSPTCRPADPGDTIYNGADDDGSGSTAVMAIAKAMATGPRPKRSVLFIWHSGEEAGLLGSRYMADFPVVPLDRVQAEFNIDMIGRNRDDDPAQANTVYVIGADRISTGLHNLIIETNRQLPKPLTLGFEYNDASDPNTFYTRSDHYSYASKGIPIAFFFTGTHLDYHCVTDEVSRILFPKLVRIAQFIYEAGFSLADSPQPLIRDNRGPRSGRGFAGGTLEEGPAQE